MFASHVSHPRMKLVGSWFCALLVSGALLNGCGKSKSPSEPIITPVAPTASFTRTPDVPGPAPLTVQFTDTSTPGSAAIIAYSWNFGDTKSSTVKNPSHVYAADGTFEASLTVTTSVGSSTSQPSSVVVTTTTVPVGPTANFEFTPPSGPKDVTVFQFTDKSIAGTSPITDWSWDFGDGTARGTGNSTSHTYSRDGNFPVSLTVTTIVGKNTKTAPANLVVATPLGDAEVLAIIMHAGVQKAATPVADQPGAPVLDHATPIFTYTTRTHGDVTNPEEINTFGNNDGVLYPGAIIKGEGLTKFVYTPISPRGPTHLGRAGLMLSVNVKNGSGPVRHFVKPEDVTLDGLREGIKTLIDTAKITNVPVLGEFKTYQVFSSSQLAEDLGGSVGSAAIGELAGHLHFESDKTTTKYVASYKQIYYTVNMTNPDGLAGFFAPGTTAQELSAAFPEGSDPVYVSSVKYGFEAFLTVESTYSSETTQLALDYARDNKWDTKLDASHTARSVLGHSKVSLLVYGSSASAFETFLDSANVIAAFQRLVRDNVGEPKNAVPLFYTFNHLHDYSLANITETAKWTEVIRLRIAQEVKITAIKWVCEHGDDGFDDSTMEMIRLYMYLSASNGKASGSEPIPSEQSQRVFDYNNNNNVGIAMTTDTVVPCAGLMPNEHVVTFSTDANKGFNFDHAVLDFSAYGEDWDGATANDGAGAKTTIFGADFLKSDGTLESGHSTMLLSNDYTIRLYFKIELVE